MITFVSLLAHEFILLNRKCAEVSTHANWMRGVMMHLERLLKGQEGKFYKSTVSFKTSHVVYDTNP